MRKLFLFLVCLFVLIPSLSYSQISAVEDQDGVRKFPWKLKFAGCTQTFLNGVSTLNCGTEIAGKFGLYANRPVTCTEPESYWSTDTNALYVCTAGNTWTQIAPFTGGTVPGATTFQAGISVQNGATGPGFINLYEDSDNGTNYLQILGLATLASNPTLLLGATFTNGKWCSYSTTTGLTCNENVPADVTDVGDCISGACLDGSADGGTYIQFYDGTSSYMKLLAGVRQFGFYSGLVNVEDLIFTLGNNDNTITVSSTTGANSFTFTGMDVTATSFTASASASPTELFKDSDAPGSDKEIAKIVGGYVDGADGSENGTLDLYVHEGGTSTSQMQFDGKNQRINVYKPMQSTLSIKTSGIINGAIQPLWKTVGYTVGSTSVYELYGSAFLMSAAAPPGTFTLGNSTAVPAVGANVILRGMSANTVYVNPRATDKIRLKASATALSAGSGIKNTTAAIGDFITLIADSSDGSGNVVWGEYGSSGTWAVQ